MAANFGKFIDRSPQICAAGMSSALSYREGEDMRHDESLEGNSIKENKKFIEDEKIYTEDNVAPSEPTENMSLPAAGIKTQQEEGPTFTKELEGSMYQHQQNNISKDGVYSQDEDSVTALMHPTSTPYQVMWDSQVGHEKYRTTHDDYNAPKKIEECDVIPGPEKCLNAAGKYNTSGIWVRCMCDWHKKELVDRSAEIEADYVDTHRSQIGKSLNPNHNIDSVPKGFAFGLHSQHASYGMEELMKDSDCPPCIFKRHFYQWMASLNKCRNDLKERDFDFKKFRTTLLDHDVEDTGFLQVDEVHEICAHAHITYHKENVEALLKLLKIIVDDKIDYGRFIDMIDVNRPTIDIVPIHDLPKHNQHYETSSHAADYLITSNADMQPAGVTSSHGGVFAEPNVAHTQLRGTGQESLGSPLNFQNK